MEAFVVIVWLVFSIVVGVVASGKGRSAFGWFLFSLLLSPLLGLIIVAVLQADRRELDRRALAAGILKKCPQCAELVKSEAKICRACRYEFGPAAGGGAGTGGPGEVSWADVSNIG